MSNSIRLGDLLEQQRLASLRLRADRRRDQPLLFRCLGPWWDEVRARGLPIYFLVYNPSSTAMLEPIFFLLYLLAPFLAQDAFNLIYSPPQVPPAHPHPTPTSSSGLA